MKNISLILSICLINFCLTAQVNYELKNQLDSIQELDQRYREEVGKVMSNKSYLDSLSQLNGFLLSDYVRDLMLKQEFIDKSNINFIDSIIQIYGYPGLSLVGNSTNQTTWYVIQHSEKIDKYYKILEKASKKGEIPDSLFAKTKDRYLIQRGKKQLFGTQADCLPNETGNFNCFISPIRNSKKVNKRRKKAGFSSTIEVYAELNGFEFKSKDKSK